nr:uncharacterized protein LOC123763651 [Procambarus clarkii]
MALVTLAALILFLHHRGACGVHIRGVEVPLEARAGEDVPLRCWVDPWQGPLYSLAWWKDGTQFYRSVLTTSVGSLASLFPLPGLTVKGGGGGMGHVVLVGVEVAASGTYSCEAVADFPSFSQHLVTANLTVVDPPDTRPVIAGYKTRYYPGEVLAANCTVLRAHPAPTVFWFINGHQVEEGRREVMEVTLEADLTFTLTARFTLRLKRHHFVNDAVNLTCGAQVGQSFWTTTTVTTRRALPHHHHTALNHHLQEPTDDNKSPPHFGSHTGGTSTTCCPNVLVSVVAVCVWALLWA